MCRPAGDAASADVTLRVRLSEGEAEGVEIDPGVRGGHRTADSGVALPSRSSTVQCRAMAHCRAAVYGATAGASAWRPIGASALR